MTINELKLNHQKILRDCRSKSSDGKIRIDGKDVDQETAIHIANFYDKLIRQVNDIKKRGI